MSTTQARSKVIKSLRGGQMTIPAEFRKELEIEENSLLRVTLTGDGELLVRPLKTVERSGGSEWLKELYELFEPVRREVEASGMSDDEINALIDEAVAEVRARRSAGETKLPS